MQADGVQAQNVGGAGGGAGVGKLKRLWDSTKSKIIGQIKD